MFYGTLLNTEQDVWAPPFGRRRLGISIWASGYLGQSSIELLFIKALFS